MAAIMHLSAADFDMIRSALTEDVLPVSHPNIERLLNLGELMEVFKQDEGPGVTLVMKFEGTVSELD